MSLDSIVRITISTQNVQMAQAGFGIPLIIVQHDVWSERVRSFSNLSEIPLTDPKEPTKKGFAADSSLYRMVQTIMAQNPKITKLKIGKRIKDETIETAFNAIKNEDGNFYGVLIVNEHGSDAVKYAADIDSLAKAVKGRRFLAGADVFDGQLATATALKDSKTRNLLLMYKDTAGFPTAGWMGKMLAQAPGSPSWAFKQLEDVTPSKLSLDTIDKLKAANVNRYIDINGDGVTMDGKVASGEYIDVVHGIDWLHVRIQERLLRLLMINGKIPYTAKGVDLVRSEIMAQLKEAVYRGLLASDPEPQVSIPAIADIPAAMRGQRMLPDVLFSARLAGAIHEIEIRGTVSV